MENTEHALTQLVRVFVVLPCEKGDRGPFVGASRRPANAVHVVLLKIDCVTRRKRYRNKYRRKTDIQISVYGLWRMGPQ